MVSAGGGETSGPNKRAVRKITFVLRKPPRQSRAMEVLKNAVFNKLAVSSDRGNLSPERRKQIEERLSSLIPEILKHTPNHPPYAEMILRAIEKLEEEHGSSEESISRFIESNYGDLPWAHSHFLPHHLRRLVETGEIIAAPNSCYVLPQSNPISGHGQEEVDDDGNGLMVVPISSSRSSMNLVENEVSLVQQLRGRSRHSKKHKSEGQKEPLTIQVRAKMMRSWSDDANDGLMVQPNEHLVVMMEKEESLKQQQPQQPKRRGRPRKEHGCEKQTQPQEEPVGMGTIQSLDDEYRDGLMIQASEPLTVVIDNEPLLQQPLLLPSPQGSPPKEPGCEQHNQPHQEPVENGTMGPIDDGDDSATKVFECGSMIETGEQEKELSLMEENKEPSQQPQPARRRGRPPKKSGGEQEKPQLELPMVVTVYKEPFVMENKEPSQQQHQPRRWGKQSCGSEQQKQTEQEGNAGTDTDGSVVLYSGFPRSVMEEPSLIVEVVEKEEEEPFQRQPQQQQLRRRGRQPSRSKQQKQAEEEGTPGTDNDGSGILSSGSPTSVVEKGLTVIEEVEEEVEKPSQRPWQRRGRSPHTSEQQKQPEQEGTTGTDNDGSVVFHSGPPMPVMEKEPSVAEEVEEEVKPSLQQPQQKQRRRGRRPKKQKCEQQKQPQEDGIEMLECPDESGLLMVLPGGPPKALLEGKEHYLMEEPPQQQQRRQKKPRGRPWGWKKALSQQHLRRQSRRLKELQQQELGTDTMPVCLDADVSMILFDEAPSIVTEENDSSLIEAEASLQLPQPMLRGRPPKKQQKQEGIDSDAVEPGKPDMAEMEEEPSPQPKRRGRPPKRAKPKPTAAIVKLKYPHRGRPPKLNPMS